MKKIKKLQELREEREELIGLIDHCDNEIKRIDDMDNKTIDDKKTKRHMQKEKYRHEQRLVRLEKIIKAKKIMYTKIRQTKLSYIKTKDIINHKKGFSESQFSKVYDENSIYMGYWVEKNTVWVYYRYKDDKFMIAKFRENTILGDFREEYVFDFNNGVLNMN